MQQDEAEMKSRRKHLGTPQAFGAGMGFTRSPKPENTRYLRSEGGSISPLVITYFLITLLVVFIGINITHSYLERRHLILAMESSLQRATQVIDDLSYYTGYVERNTLRFRQRGQTTFVPIDCKAARQIFDREFTTQWALTKALNLPDDNVVGDHELRVGGSRVQGWNFGGTATKPGSLSTPGSSSTPGSMSTQGSSSARPPSAERLLSIPTVTSFSCDGRTAVASAELLVELPFQITFAGVDFMRFSRQDVRVEVGLILGG